MLVQEAWYEYPFISVKIDNEEGEHDALLHIKVCRQGYTQYHPELEDQDKSNEEPCKKYAPSTLYTCLVTPYRIE